MDYLINAWVSIPQDIRYQIVMIATFLIPPFIVVLCNYERAEIIIGAFVFIIPVCIQTYIECSHPAEYCTGDDSELGIYIFAFFLGLIYCFFIKFIYLSIKNFFTRNR
jgi:hypothetical protein